MKLTLAKINEAIARAAFIEKRTCLPACMAYRHPTGTVILLGSNMGEHERVRRRVSQALGIRDICSHRAEGIEENWEHIP